MNYLIAVFSLLLSVNSWANFGAVGGIDGVNPGAASELKTLEDELVDSGLPPSQAQSLATEVETKNEFSVTGGELAESTKQSLNSLIEKRLQLEAAGGNDATLQAEIDQLSGQLNDAVTNLKRQIQTEAALQRLTDRVNSGGDIDTATPQPQNPENRFVLVSNAQSVPWNQSMQLRATGGVAGTISYHRRSGQCDVSVSGLVTLGIPIPAGDETSACVVYAKNTLLPTEWWQSDDLNLAFTKQCNDEGIPLTVQASSQANLGQTVQIQASGGGCVGLVDDQLNDVGFIQFYEASPACSVDSNGRVTATQAGSCSVTVTKASAGAINPSVQEIVEITFVDPDINAPLHATADAMTVESGGRSSLQVTGGGPGSPTFSVVQPAGGICTVDTNGVVQASGNTTCAAYARKNGQTAGPVCINFGRGSVVPPPECRPDSFSDGPFVVTNPLGNGQVNGSHDQLAGYLHEVGYRGGNGTDLGLVTFSLAEANQDCRVFTNSVSASTDTVCKIRAYSGGLAQYSNNWICVPFGSAPLSDACTIENSGGTAAADFDFTFTGSDTGNALDSEIVLTGINLGAGGSADWAFTGQFPYECVFNGGNNTKLGQTQVTLIHHANRGPGICGVRAWRQGFPDDAVTKCFAFGDYQITDRINCTGSAPAPELTFSASSQTINAGTITFTAALSRDLGQGESLSVTPVLDGGNPSDQGCLFAGPETRSFINGYAQDDLQRALTCTTSGTYQMRAVLSWDGEDIEQTVCVRFGDGSVNAQCPDLSATPPEETADSGAITFDVLDSYPLNERITLTAENAGDNPSWLVTRNPVFNLRQGLSEANLVSCSNFTTSDPSERDMQVNHYAAICEVTLRHTDDPSNQITRCVNFGDVSVPSNMASYVNGVCGTDY
ncbi:MAG: hypothetical protein ACPGU3_07865 [Litorivicinus sp.]